MSHFGPPGELPSPSLNGLSLRIHVGQEILQYLCRALTRIPTSSATPIAELMIHGTLLCLGTSACITSPEPYPQHFCIQNGMTNRHLLPLRHLATSRDGRRAVLLLQKKDTHTSGIFPAALRCLRRFGRRGETNGRPRRYGTPRPRGKNVAAAMVTP